MSTAESQSEKHVDKDVEAYLKQEEDLNHLLRQLKSSQNIEKIFSNAKSMLETKQKVEHYFPEPTPTRAIPAQSELKWNVLYSVLLVSALGFFARGFGLL